MLWVGWDLCASTDVPVSDEWLAPGEARVLSRLRFDKRRGDFRLGRFTAKRVLGSAWRRGAVPGATPPRFSVEAAEDGAPEARSWDGAPVPFVVSITHSQSLAASAVAVGEPGDAVRLGCDLERVEARSDELVRQFFSETERRKLARVETGSAALYRTLVWSAKESALKALRVGLTMDTRSVEVEWTAGGEVDQWQALTARAGDERFAGFWRLIRQNDHAPWVLSVLSSPPCSEPERL